MMMMINGQCTSHCLLYDGPLLCGFNVAIKGLNLEIKALRNGNVLLFVCQFVRLSICRQKQAN